MPATHSILFPAKPSLIDFNIGMPPATEASKAWLDYGFNQMNIQEMNAYTHSENGASNHVLQKVGFNFKEDYPDKEGIIWKWWQLKKLEFRTLK